MDNLAAALNAYFAALVIAAEALEAVFKELTKG